jgi:hypothetical protein
LPTSLVLGTLGRLGLFPCRPLNDAPLFPRLEDRRAVGL